MEPNVWEIVTKNDGTFEIFHEGQLLKACIPDKWLESELAKYGFCGEEYHQIRRELERQGRAEIVL